MRCCRMQEGERQAVVILCESVGDPGWIPGHAFRVIGWIANGHDSGPRKQFKGWNSSACLRGKVPKDTAIGMGVLIQLAPG